MITETEYQQILAKLRVLVKEQPQWLKIYNQERKYYNQPILKIINK